MASSVILPVTMTLDAAAARQVEAQIQAVSKRMDRLIAGGGHLSRAYSQPLGRITGAADEFSKSLEASNARVIAFGASAGVIFLVQKALSETITAAISVEKALQDINVILDLSAQSLAKFGTSLFAVAKNTGQAFDQVAKAALEFSRQGLSVEETLKRTNDALILTRLSGLDVVDSTEAITAALNTFNQTALDSTTYVNKLANVDAAFAVSSRDLAEAVKRVGSSAQDAGVGLDELIAVVTATQQATARGGAVIGNSLKTIFTRAQRPEVIANLQAFGVAVKDSAGNALPAIEILRNFANAYEGMLPAQKSVAAEMLGGVFQINVLKAAVSDLGKEYSVYDRALAVSMGATDQAISRNDKLNQTFASLFNETSNNAKQFAASIGKGTFEPALRSVLGFSNDIFEAISAKDPESIGSKIGSGVVEGIGRYLGTSGLALLGFLGAKLFKNFASFSSNAVGSFVGLNSEAKKQQELQQFVQNILVRNPQLIDLAKRGAEGQLAVEKELLRVSRERSSILEQSAKFAASMSSRIAPQAISAMNKAEKAQGAGSSFSRGFVPSLAEAEVRGALTGGYKPGNVVPSPVGGVMNTAETVKYVPGFSQPFINPPERSKAGKEHKIKSMEQAGVNPYAFSGFVPNFAQPTEFLEEDPFNLKKYNGSIKGTAKAYPKTKTQLEAIKKLRDRIKKSSEPLNGDKQATRKQQKWEAVAEAVKSYKALGIQTTGELELRLGFSQNSFSTYSSNKKGKDGELSANAAGVEKAIGPKSFEALSKKAEELAQSGRQKSPKAARLGREFESKVAAAFDLPAESANSRPMDFSGVRALKKQKIKNKISMDPKTFVGDAHNTYGHGDDFFFNKYVRQKGEDGSPIALGLNNRLEEEQQRRQKISSKGGAPKKNPVTVPNVGRYTEILNGGSKKDSNYQAFTFKVKDVREHAQKSISKYLDKKYNDETIRFSYAKDGIDLSKLDKSATGLIPNFAGYSSASVGISKAFQEQRLKSGEQTDAFQNKYHLAVGSNTVHPAFKKAFEKNGIPFSQSKRGFDLTDLKGSYAKLSQAAADAKTFAPTDPEERRSIAGEKNTSDESFAKVWSDYIDSYLNTKKITEISSLVTSQGPKSDFSSVRSAGFIPNFAPTKGGKFYDFDETLVHYPTGINPGEMFSPESIKKAYLSTLGESLVGSKDPINVLTARESNSRAAIQNFLQKSQIPVGKVFTSGSMYRKEGLDSASKKAKFAEQMMGKYPEAIAFNLEDDSEDNVEALASLKNPKITGSLYKDEKKQQKLGQRLTKPPTPVLNKVFELKSKASSKDAIRNIQKNPARGRSGEVQGWEVSHELGRLFEEQLKVGGLAQAGFTNINHLSRKDAPAPFGNNFPADFYARNGKGPWFLDAKNTKENETKKSRLGAKATTMQNAWENIEGTPSHVNFLEKDLSEKISKGQEAMNFGVVASSVPGTTARGYAVPRKNDAVKIESFETVGGGSTYRNFSRGFVPNFAPLDDAMSRERSAAGSAVPLFSKMLNSPVVVNNEQIAKYGSNADRIIQGDHIENGQVATRSNLMKSGSGKEKYSSKGFVPNFGEAPRMIGEGASRRAFLSIGKNGEENVFKTPHKTGSRRGEAIADAIDQQTLSQRYKKALAPFPWFNALEQKNAGGGILKQPLAKGKRLSEVLEKAYPSDRGAGREVAERSKSGALGSFQKFFGKLGLPYDSMGMAGNILVPEEHQAKVVEIFQKQARYLYAKMFGNQGGGFPNGAFNIIDYAKGFVPNFVPKKLIDQKGGPDAGKRKIFSEMGEDDLASLMEARYRPSGSYEEPRNLNSNNLLFKILRGNRGTPWIDQTLADYDLFERSEVNEKGKYPDEEARALSRAKWARDYFPKKEKIIKSAFFPSSGAPGSRPTRSEGFIPNFASGLVPQFAERKTPPAKGIGPLHRDFLAQVPQDLPKLLKDSPEAVKTINRLYEEHKGLKYVANGGESFVFKTEGKGVLKVPYVFPREDPKSRKNGEEEHQGVLNDLFAGKKVDTKQNNIQEKMRRVGRFDWEGAKKDLAGTNLVLPKSSVSADGSHYSQPFAGSVLSNVITRKSVGSGDLDPYAINRSIMGSIDATFKKRQKSKTDHPINRMFLDTGSVENFTFIDPKKNFDANNILLDDRKTAKKIFAKNDFGLIDVGLYAAEGFIPNFAHHPRHGLGPNLKPDELKDLAIFKDRPDILETAEYLDSGTEGIVYEYTLPSGKKKTIKISKSAKRTPKDVITKNKKLRGFYRDKTIFGAYGDPETSFSVQYADFKNRKKTKGISTREALLQELEDPNSATQKNLIFKAQFGAFKKIKEDKGEGKQGRTGVMADEERAGTEDFKNAQQSGIKSYFERVKALRAAPESEFQAEYDPTDKSYIAGPKGSVSKKGIRNLNIATAIDPNGTAVTFKDKVEYGKDSRRATLSERDFLAGILKKYGLTPDRHKGILEATVDKEGIGAFDPAYSRGFVPNFAELLNYYHVGDLSGGLKPGGIHLSRSLDDAILVGSSITGINERSNLYKLSLNKALSPERGIESVDDGENSLRRVMKDGRKQKVKNPTHADYTNLIEGVSLDPSGKAGFLKSTMLLDKNLVKNIENMGPFSKFKGRKIEGRKPFNPAYLTEDHFKGYSEGELKELNRQGVDLKNYRRSSGLAGGFVPNLAERNATGEGRFDRFATFLTQKGDKPEDHPLSFQNGIAKIRYGNLGMSANDFTDFHNYLASRSMSGLRADITGGYFAGAAPANLSEFSQELKDRFKRIREAGNYPEEYPIFDGAAGGFVPNFGQFSPVESRQILRDFLKIQREVVDPNRKSGYKTLHRGVRGQSPRWANVDLENADEIREAVFRAPQPRTPATIQESLDIFRSKSFQQLTEGNRSDPGGSLSSKKTLPFVSTSISKSVAEGFAGEGGVVRSSKIKTNRILVEEEKYKPLYDKYGKTKVKEVLFRASKVGGGRGLGLDANRISPGSKYREEKEIPLFSGGFVPNFGAAKRERNETKRFDLNRMTKGGDGALNDAYNYGLSTEGANFGWKANQASAKYAMRLIGSGETDIEKISDAVHKGWSSTAFSDSAGKLKLDKATPESKKAKRLVLANQSYSELSEEEKEKDRVLARAYLKDYQENQGKQKNASGGFVPNFNLTEREASLQKDEKTGLLPHPGYKPDMGNDIPYYKRGGPSQMDMANMPYYKREALLRKRRSGGGFSYSRGFVPNFKKQTGLKKEKLSFKAGKRSLVNLDEIDAEDGAEHGSIETFGENEKKVGYLKYIEDSESLFIEMNKNSKKGNSKFSGIGFRQFVELKNLAQKKGKVIKSSEITPQKDKLKLVGNPDSTNWADFLAVQPQLKHRITEGLTTSGSLSIMGRGISKSFSNIEELRGFTNSIPRQDFLSDLKSGRILINELESAPTDGIADAKVPFAAEGFIPNFAERNATGEGRFDRFATFLTQKGDKPEDHPLSFQNGIAKIRYGNVMTENDFTDFHNYLASRSMSGLRADITGGYFAGAAPANLSEFSQELKDRFKRIKEAGNYPEEYPIFNGAAGGFVPNFGQVSPVESRQILRDFLKIQREVVDPNRKSGHKTLHRGVRGQSPRWANVDLENADEIREEVFRPPQPRTPATIQESLDIFRSKSFQQLTEGNRSDPGGSLSSKKTLPFVSTSISKSVAEGFAGEGGVVRSSKIKTNRILVEEEQYKPLYDKYGKTKVKEVLFRASKVGGGRGLGLDANRISPDTKYREEKEIALFSGGFVSNSSQGFVPNFSTFRKRKRRRELVSEGLQPAPNVLQTFVEGFMPNSFTRQYDNEGGILSDVTKDPRTLKEKLSDYVTHFDSDPANALHTLVEDLMPKSYTRQYDDKGRIPSDVTKDRLHGEFKDPRTLTAKLSDYLTNFSVFSQGFVPNLAYRDLNPIGSAIQAGRKQSRLTQEARDEALNNEMVFNYGSESYADQMKETVDSYNESGGKISVEESGREEAKTNFARQIKQTVRAGSPKELADFAQHAKANKSPVSFLLEGKAKEIRLPGFNKGFVPNFVKTKKGPLPAPGAQPEEEGQKVSFKQLRDEYMAKQRVIETFSYPFRVKGSGVSAESMSGAGLDPKGKKYSDLYEEQLQAEGFGSLGFKGAQALRSSFGNNIEADFFATKDGIPYLVDAKAGHGDSDASNFAGKLTTISNLISSSTLDKYLSDEDVQKKDLRIAAIFGNINPFAQKKMTEAGVFKEAPEERFYDFDDTLAKYPTGGFMSKGTPVSFEEADRSLFSTKSLVHAMPTDMAKDLKKDADERPGFKFSINTARGSWFNNEEAPTTAIRKTLTSSKFGFADASIKEIIAIGEIKKTKTDNQKKEDLRLAKELGIDVHVPKRGANKGIPTPSTEDLKYVEIYKRTLGKHPAVMYDDNEKMATNAETVKQRGNIRFQYVPSESGESLGANAGDSAPTKTSAASMPSGTELPKNAPPGFEWEQTDGKWKLARKAATAAVAAEGFVPNFMPAKEKEKEEENKRLAALFEELHDLNPNEDKNISIGSLMSKHGFHKNKLLSGAGAITQNEKGEYTINQDATPSSQHRATTLLNVLNSRIPIEKYPKILQNTLKLSEKGRSAAMERGITFEKKIADNFGVAASASSRPIDFSKGRELPPDPRDGGVTREMLGMGSETMGEAHENAGHGDAAMYNKILRDLVLNGEKEKAKKIIEGEAVNTGYYEILGGGEDDLKAGGVQIDFGKVYDLARTGLEVFQDTEKDKKISMNYIKDNIEFPDANVSVQDSVKKKKANRAKDESNEDFGVAETPLGVLQRVRRKLFATSEGYVPNFKVSYPKASKPIRVSPIKTKSSNTKARGYSPKSPRKFIGASEGFVPNFSRPILNPRDWTSGIIEANKPTWRGLGAPLERIQPESRRPSPARGERTKQSKLREEEMKKSAEGNPMLLEMMEEAEAWNLSSDGWLRYQELHAGPGSATGFAGGFVPNFVQTALRAGFVPNFAGKYSSQNIQISIGKVSEHKKAAKRSYDTWKAGVDKAHKEKTPEPTEPDHWSGLESYVYNALTSAREGGGEKPFVNHSEQEKEDYQSALRDFDGQQFGPRNERIIRDPWIGIKVKKVKEQSKGKVNGIPVANWKSYFSMDADSLNKVAVKALFLKQRLEKIAEANNSSLSFKVPGHKNLAVDHNDSLVVHYGQEKIADELERAVRDFVKEVGGQTGQRLYTRGYDLDLTGTGIKSVNAPVNSDGSSTITYGGILARRFAEVIAKGKDPNSVSNSELQEAFKVFKGTVPETSSAPPKVSSLSPGFVPNFFSQDAAIEEAQSREQRQVSQSTGIPKSRVSTRVGYSSELVTPNNPSGAGVFSPTIGQNNLPSAFADHKGENLRTANKFASSGFVPNFLAGTDFRVGEGVEVKRTSGEWSGGKIQKIDGDIGKVLVDKGEGIKPYVDLTSDEEIRKLRPVGAGIQKGREDGIAIGRGLAARERERRQIRNSMDEAQQNATETVASKPTLTPEGKNMGAGLADRQLKAAKDLRQRMIQAQQDAAAKRVLPVAPVSPAAPVAPEAKPPLVNTRSFEEMRPVPAARLQESKNGRDMLAGFKKQSEKENIQTFAEVRANSNPPVTPPTYPPAPAAPEVVQKATDAGTKAAVTPSALRPQSASSTSSPTPPSGSSNLIDSVVEIATTIKKGAALAKGLADISGNQKAIDLANKAGTLSGEFLNVAEAAQAYKNTKGTVNKLITGANFISAGISAVKEVMPAAAPGAKPKLNAKEFDPNSYIGKGDKFNCGDFSSQAEAQAVLRADPSDPNKLDADKDGIACEKNKRPKDRTQVRRSNIASSATPTKVAAGITAAGFVPNFNSAIGKAKKREMAAGYSSSEVIVGEDSRLSGRIGVFNKGQGSLRAAINEHLSSGQSMSELQTQGMSRGFVPNFAEDPMASMNTGLHAAFGAVEYMIDNRLKSALEKLSSTIEENSGKLSEAQAEAIKSMNDGTGTTDTTGLSVDENTEYQDLVAAAVSVKEAQMSTSMGGVALSDDQKVLAKSQAITEVSSSSRGSELQQNAREAQRKKGSGTFDDKGKELTYEDLDENLKNEKADQKVKNEAHGKRKSTAKKVDVGISLASGGLQMMDDSALKTGLNSAAKGASMAASALSAIPGPAGLFVAGGIALTTAVVGAFEAITNIGEAYKIAADLSQKKFQELSSSLDAYGQALNQLTESYTDSSVTNETIQKLQKRQADAMMNVEDPALRQKLMTAGGAKEQQKVLVEVKEEAARKNEIAQKNSQLASAADNDRKKSVGFGVFSEGPGGGRRYDERNMFGYQSKSMVQRSKDNLKNDAVSTLSNMTVKGREDASKVLSSGKGPAEMVAELQRIGSITAEQAEVMKNLSFDNLKDLINKMKELDVQSKIDASSLKMLKTVRDNELQKLRRLEDASKAAHAAVNNLSDQLGARLSRNVSRVNFREELGDKRRSDIRGGEIDAASMAAKREAKFFGTEEQQAAVDLAANQTKIAGEGATKVEETQQRGRTDVANVISKQLEDKFKAATTDSEGKPIAADKETMGAKQELTDIISRNRQIAADQNLSPQELATRIDRDVKNMQGPNAKRAQEMFGNVAVGGDIEGILEKSQQELANISTDQLKQMEQAQRQHVETLANLKTERNIKSFGGIQGFMQGPQYEREQRKTFSKGLNLMGSKDVVKQGRGAAMVGTQLQDMFGGAGLSGALSGELQQKVQKGRTINIQDNLEKMARQADRKGETGVARELRNKKADAGKIASDQAKNAIKRDEMPANIEKQLKVLEAIKKELEKKGGKLDAANSAAAGYGIDPKTGATVQTVDVKIDPTALGEALAKAIAASQKKLNDIKTESGRIKDSSAKTGAQGSIISAIEQGVAEGGGLNKLDANQSAQLQGIKADIGSGTSDPDDIARRLKILVESVSASNKGGRDKISGAVSGTIAGNLSAAGIGDANVGDVFVTEQKVTNNNLLKVIDTIVTQTLMLAGLIVAGGLLTQAFGPKIADLGRGLLDKIKGVPKGPTPTPPVSVGGAPPAAPRPPAIPPTVTTSPTPGGVQSGIPGPRPPGPAPVRVVSLPGAPLAAPGAAAPGAAAPGGLLRLLGPAMVAVGAGLAAANYADSEEGKQDKGLDFAGGMTSAIGMGVFTGGQGTGSRMSGALGIEKGGSGDKMMGVIGAGIAGAMTGSVVPGLGTIAGAVIGVAGELGKIAIESGERKSKEESNIRDLGADSRNQARNTQLGIKTDFSQANMDAAAVSGQSEQMVEAIRARKRIIQEQIDQQTKKLQETNSQIEAEGGDKGEDKNSNKVNYLLKTRSDLEKAKTLSLKNINTLDGKEGSAAKDATADKLFFKDRVTDQNGQLPVTAEAGKKIQEMRRRQKTLMEKEGQTADEALRNAATEMGPEGDLLYQNMRKGGGTELAKEHTAKKKEAADIKLEIGKDRFAAEEAKKITDKGNAATEEEKAALQNYNKGKKGGRDEVLDVTQTGRGSINANAMNRAGFTEDDKKAYYGQTETKGKPVALQTNTPGAKTANNLPREQQDANKGIWKVESETLQTNIPGNARPQAPITNMTHAGAATANDVARDRANLGWPAELLYDEPKELTALDLKTGVKKPRGTVLPGSLIEPPAIPQSSTNGMAQAGAKTGSNLASEGVVNQPTVQNGTNGSKNSTQPDTTKVPPGATKGPDDVSSVGQKIEKSNASLVNIDSGLIELNKNFSTFLSSMNSGSPAKDSQSSQPSASAAGLEKFTELAKAIAALSETMKENSRKSEEASKAPQGGQSPSSLEGAVAIKGEIIVNAINTSDALKNAIMDEVYKNAANIVMAAAPQVGKNGSVAPSPQGPSQAKYD